jgi:DNA-binding transcriptional ArsR family regulator
MVRRAVTVVRDSKTIKILADPARREILRQVAIRPQTGTQLAKKLHLTKPTIGHHLRALQEARLIDIERTEVGSHGILEKYYEPTSSLFIEDFEGATPKPMLDFSTFAFAHFLHASMERLIGALSVLHLIEEKRGRGIKIDPEQFKELALETAKHVTRVGERYEKMELDMNRETLFIKIYSEALKMILTESKWRKLFAGAIDLGLV